MRTKTSVIDHAAWMSSIDHIRSTPGFDEQEEPDWPVAMTLEANLEDLVRHARTGHGQIAMQQQRLLEA